MSLTVFTCVFGDTDRLKKPTVVNRHLRYICLSDRLQHIAPYRTVLMPCNGDAKLLSRRVKILADHESLGNPDVVLWHDAAYRLDYDPVDVADTVLTDTNFVAFKHPHYNQIEEEAEAIKRWGWIAPQVLAAQIRTYRAEGFQQDGITSTGFCVRRLTPAVKAFNVAWWAEVEKWGWRDQMSVDYALWKTGVQPTYIPGHYRKNPYAKWHAW